jgi:hypothetical protein
MRLRPLRAIASRARSSAFTVRRFSISPHIDGHACAWKWNTANFACRAFSEVHGYKPGAEGRGRDPQHDASLRLLHCGASMEVYVRYKVARRTLARPRSSTRRRWDGSCPDGGSIQIPPVQSGQDNIYLIGGIA